MGLKGKSRHKKLTVGVVSAIAIITVVVWLIASEAPVEYTAPSLASRPATPNPNAYNTYLRASTSLVCKDQTWEGLRSRLPTHSSSKKDPPIMKLLSLLPRKNEGPLPPGVPAASNLTRLYSTIEKQAILDANAKALSGFREGLRQEFLLPRLTGNQFTKSGKLRDLCRLISLQAIVYNESGEYGKAMMTSLDALKLGNDTARGGREIDALVSTAIQAIARKPAWDMVDSLSLLETKDAIARLDSIISETVPYKATMIEENQYILPQMVQFLNSRSWRNNIASMDLAGKAVSALVFSDETPTWRDGVNYAVEYAKTYSTTRRGLFTGVKNDFSKQVEACDLAYPDFKKLKLRGSNKLSTVFVSVDEKARFEYENGRCLNDLLLLQLALHAYKLEHTRYPMKLSDLAPEYVKSLPMDPFSAGDEFKYGLTANGYLLYSIGPDTKDDDGKPVVQHNQPNSRFVDFQDIGDIVAGYNQ